MPRRRREALSGVALTALTCAAGCGGGSSADTSPYRKQADAAALRSEQILAENANQTELLRQQIATERAKRRARRAAVKPEDEGDVPGGQARSHRLLSKADGRSFAKLEASLGGESGLAVAPLGRGARPEHAGSLDTAIAWSTSKTAIAMAVIDGGQEQAQQANLRKAITASDNAAAERLWASLGGGRLAAAATEAQLRTAGDNRTHYETRRLRSGFTPFGQTVWRLTDQARFTAGMSCSGPGAEVLGLMGDVIPAQRWGLGAVGDPAQLKGGWGPGSKPGANGGDLDRQMGVVTVGGRPVAVTLATVPADGSHDTGTQHLTQISQWVVKHVDTRSLPTKAKC